MKFRIHAIFLSLFFALALCFSFSIEASAHDYTRSDGQKTYTHSDVEGVTAEDVENASAADKKEMTRKFLLHAITHRQMINDDPDLQGTENRQDRLRETAIFEKEARKLGVFNTGEQKGSNDGEIYLIGITKRGAMRNHGRYQHLYGSRYDLEKDPVKALTDAGTIEEDGAGGAVCENYQYPAGQSRWACAIKQDTPAGVVTTTAGFDHAEGDLMEPDCRAFTLDVTAQMVEDETDLNEKRKLLEDFVQSFRDEILNWLDMTRREVIEDGFQLGTRLFQDEINARLLERILCIREDHFFHGSIYPFVMDPVRGISFLNALDFNLHGLSVSLIDPNPIGDEPNVLVAFQKALTEDGSANVEKPGNLMHGKSAFVKYHWDNPVKDGDEVANFSLNGRGSRHLDQGKLPRGSGRNWRSGSQPSPLRLRFRNLSGSGDDGRRR